MIQPSRMYLHKWNEALVDWVNCLGLTDRIKDLRELKNGHFFRLLLKNLALSDGFINSDLSLDGLTVVYDHLEKEFPHYGVCEIEREVDTEVSYISSLLLLLSVTKGKNPMFRSHLCEDLQHDSQVKIKCFLESCLERCDRLDHKHLKSIIEGDFVASETTRQCRHSKEFGLPKTPLKVFFDSPRQTDKLTRDLRRLEAEHEALQIEKMELEDELRSEKEKREQIEGNLQLKNEQVVKLREELQEFAQNMEAHEKGEGIGSNYHTIKALKSEVKELESYISALTEEKSIINDEKVKLQEKLSVFQSKCKELEIRTLHSERKTEELQMILNNNNQKLHALKEYCVELEEKIRALPIQHNTSIETDTSLSFVDIVSSPYSEGERLSHVVVDVKLAEVEEENEKLKEQIKGIMEQREILTDQLKEVKDKLEKARVAQEAAKAENMKIQHKLIESSDERNQLNIALGEAKVKISKLEAYTESLKSYVKQLEEEKQNHFKEITVYERKLLDASDKVNKMETKLLELEKKTEQLTEQLAEKECLAEKASQAINASEVKLEMMEKEKESAVVRISMQEEEMKKLKCQLTEEQKIIQSLKSDQEALIAEQSQEKQKLEAYTESLKSYVKQLEEEKQNHFKEITVYERKLLDARDKVNKMETKLLELEKKTEQLTEQLAEKECLAEKTSQAINASEVKLEMMEKEKESAVVRISMQEEEMKKLKCQLTEEQKIIQSLKSDQEALIAEQSQEKQKLEAYTESLKSYVKQLEEEKQNHFKEITVYERKLLDARDKVNKMETKLLELEKKTEQLTEQLAEKECLAEKTSQAINASEVKLEMMEKEKESAVVRISMQEEEMKKLKCQLTEEQKIIQSLKSDQEALIAEQSQEKQKLEAYTESLKSYVKQIEEEKQNHFKEITVYERKLLDARDKVNKMETKLLELEKKTEQLTEQLAEKECLAEKASQAINASEVKLEMMEKEKESAVVRISIQEEEMKKLKCQLTEEQKIIQSLKSDQEALIAEQSQEKLKLEAYIESLGMDMKKLKEEKQNNFQEKSAYEKQMLDAGDKVDKLEMKVINLEKMIEQLTEQLSEKNWLIEQTSEAINDCEIKLRILKKEKDVAVENIAMQEEELKKLKAQLIEEQSIIHSLKLDQEALLAETNQEKQKLEAYIESLKSEVEQLEGEKQNCIQEMAVYEKKLFDASDKVNSLEVKLLELERMIKQQTGQLSEKNYLAEEKSKAVIEFEIHLEAMKSEKNVAIENIIAKEKELKILKDQLNERHKIIQSLKSDRDALIAQKEQVLAMLDELRTTIAILQQEQNTYNEKRLLFEFELSHWKSQCKNLEKKMEELNVQNCFTLSQKIIDSQDGAELHDKCLEKTHMVQKLNLNPDLGSLSPDNVDEKGHSNNASLHVCSTSEAKCVHSDKNFQKLSPMNVGDFEQVEITQLDVEKKLWELVSSWHELEIVLEKLQEMQNQLGGKISCLWETIPRTQLKCKELFHSKGSAHILGKEVEQSKEVAMRLESMIRSLEKHHSSLERELMHAFYTAVSWGLGRIQGQFSEVSNDGIRCDIARLTDLDVDLCQLQDQRKEIYSSLDTIRDKFSQALEDANSTTEIFREVERRCESASDALEYLKRNCLFEEEMLCGIKGDKTSGKDGEALERALEEMEIAKGDLERITKETRQELEKNQREKENLVRKVESLTCHNNMLENKLRHSEEKVEKVRQETLEKVQKIFEEKLVKAKEKLKTLYMEDVKNFDEEIQGYKKCRNLALDYEKRLHDATAQIDDLRNKVEILKKQKSLLEDKLKMSKMELGTGDVRRESLMPDIYKSHSVEHIANYFAEGKLADPSNMKFQSERSLNPENISSSFSRESVHSNLPSGMGQVFCAEDEEGELFNATYLTDLKEGKCILASNETNKKRDTLGVLNDNIKLNHDKASGVFVDSENPNKRLTELMRRNTLCLPHLKSSYPTETQFHDPKNFSEDFLKGNFSLKAPLLGENQSRRLSDLRRRKDIGQTTYMKPGPPTPGKNRRASLQGPEHGIEQGKIQSTPGRFRSWFGRGKRAVPISDAENIPVTPRTKQKGLLRRALANLERDGS